jgi:hypothetical protein
MAASRVNRLGSGDPLLLGPIVALVVHHGAEVLSADASLDQRGSFDYETQTCSLTQAFPASLYLSRPWLNMVLASPASSTGLILM